MALLSIELGWVAADGSSTRTHQQNMRAFLQDSTGTMVDPNAHNKATIVGASMSSECCYGPAWRCFDGDLTNYCHTGMDSPNAWLSLELSTTLTVSKVRVYNRDNSCCFQRLGHYEVWVGEVAGQSQWPSTKCAETQVHGSHYGPFDTMCDSTNGLPVGKYVTVVLPKASDQWGWPNGRQLNLAEVEVFGGSGPDITTVVHNGHNKATIIGASMSS